MTPDQLLHLAQQGGSYTPDPYRVFSDGTAIWVYAMAYGNGRLCIGQESDRCGFDRGFCYQGIDNAFAAADEWDGQGEPPRWFKNLQTGRYRKDGDPTKEYGPKDVEIPA